MCGRTARTRSRDMRITSLSHVTPSSADRPAEQSHYLELMIGALVWRPTVRLSSRTPCARLLLAWRPWSSPFGKAAPSLGTNLLGHERERHEENVWCVGRDVSPYGCDDVISCLSACPSHQRHSPDPYSTRALTAVNEESLNSTRGSTFQACNKPYTL